MLLTYLIYFVASVVVAFFGRNRKFGFWGYFFASLLFTPLIGAIIILGSDPRPREYGDRATARR